MKIQTQNAYNPNMKALYFTKTVPMKSPTVDYINQKITNMGVKYVEDNSAKLTPLVREAFAENSFIKYLVEKFDVFVNYRGEDFYSDSFTSSASIHVVRQEDKDVFSDSYIFSSKDNYTPEGARLRLFTKIREKDYVDKSTYKLEKFRTLVNESTK